MNLIWDYLNSPAAQTWSSVLLHFVWQGFVIVGFASLFLRHMKQENAAQRYLLCLAAMFGMFAAPVATWSMIEADIQPISATEMSVVLSEIEKNASATALPVSSPSLELLDVVASSDDMASAPIPTMSAWPLNVQLFRASIFAIWLCVEFTLAGRLLLGAALLWRIRRQAEVVSSEIQEAATRLAKRLGISRIPLVLSSQRIQDASTYGIFRSVILLPASWLTEMTPEMIEAVLAHELAHVRRYDAWVNLMQRLLEVLFFFHPAVWWLSTQLRVEREHHCDSEAVRVTGDRGLFAKTLEAAARSRSGLEIAFTSNLGDNPMSLLNRVNRVLNKPYQSRPAHRWQLGLLALLLPVLIVWSGSPAKQSLAEEEFKDFLVDKPAGAITVDANGAVQVQQNGNKFTWHFEEVKNNPPTEAKKYTLPNYVIEPPDILSIEGIKLVPKGPVKIKPQDVLQIVVSGTSKDNPIAGQYLVDNQGEVSLGPDYGRVKLSGSTVVDAEKNIQSWLKKNFLKNAKVSVVMFQQSGQQFITGEHLVAPDGRVNLGIYGPVKLSGLRVEDAKRKLEEHLSKWFENPTISLNVHVYNSKFYYVITESTNQRSDGESVFRMPSTGNETVLDAVASLGGLENSNVQIWISRPNGQDKDATLQVDWDAITRGADTSSNYQLLPGDRLFISRATDKLNARAITQEFNKLVRQQQYLQAVDLVKGIPTTDATMENLKPLREKAEQLRKNLTAIQVASDEEVAGLIAELKETQLADITARKALRKKLEISIASEPLSSVLAQISDQIQIDIIIDTVGLALEGISRDTNVAIKLRQKVSADKALKLILAPHRLAHHVENGMIHVTSEEKAKDKKSTKVVTPALAK